MSETLKKFLSEWLAWAELGAPEHKTFQPWSGLCYTLIRWGASSKVQCEFANLLIDTLDDDEYPFGGQKIFDHDNHNQTMHLNEARLAWVREQLGKQA